MQIANTPDNVCSFSHDFTTWSVVLWKKESHYKGNGVINELIGWFVIKILWRKRGVVESKYEGDDRRERERERER